jgi:hypothetical protein
MRLLALCVLPGAKKGGRLDSRAGSSLRECHLARPWGKVGTVQAGAMLVGRSSGVLPHLAVMASIFADHLIERGASAREASFLIRDIEGCIQSDGNSGQ